MAKGVVTSCLLFSGRPEEEDVDDEHGAPPTCLRAAVGEMTRGEGPSQPPASQGSFGLCIIDECSE